MRKFALVVGIVVALGLGGVQSAVAANPGVNHYTIADSFTDGDFCGTGQAVDISAFIRVTEFFEPNQPVDYRNVTQGYNVFTNPVSGAKVILHFAGPYSYAFSGDPQGINTLDQVNKGLPEMIRTAHGGVLIRDAGYIVFRTVFNGNEPISSEIVVNRGPHPEADSDFTLFCEVIPTALGL